MRRHAPSVLIFDSGVGGLSIARSIWQRLPDARLVYLADNAHFPYGDQPEAVVVDRCVSLIRSVLAQEPVDMVVIGCNTASTVVLPALRSVVKQPVVGVVPAIKPAAVLSRNRRIGLLATPATIQRPYLDQLVRDFAADCELVRVGSSELVRLVEGGLSDGHVDRAVLTEITAPFRDAGVDTLVLGCTHFPLIRNDLAATLDEKVIWVDSGEAIARRVAHLWDHYPQDGQIESALRPHHLLFTGGEPPGLSAYLERQAIGSARISGDYRTQALTK